MRLDVYLSTQGLCDSRARAQDAIQEGRVTVNGRIAKKSSMPVDDSMDIKLEEAETAFASRAGYKLYDVLKPFEIDLEGRVVLEYRFSTFKAISFSYSGNYSMLLLPAAFKNWQCNWLQ